MKLIVAGLLLAAILVPAGLAQQTIANSCAPDVVSGNVAGIINSGTQRFCVYTDTVVHSEAEPNADSGRFTAAYTAPTITNPVVVYTLNIISGCTISSTNQVETTTGGATISTAHWSVDLATGSQQCHGVIKIRVDGGIVATKVYEMYLPWMIQTEERNVDNLVRICANSDFNTTCDSILTAIWDWAPLVIGFTILAIATMRARPNYFAVIVAGAFLVWSSVESPYGDTTTRLMVALFGMFNALLGALSLMDESKKDESMEG